MFLQQPIIYIICIIYIYFYILRRFIIYGLRYILSVCRKVKAVRRIIIFCVRVALWGFIEIKSIAVFTLHKIAFINQLYKLVTISRGRHTNSLTNGGGGESQCEAVGVGRKV